MRKFCKDCEFYNRTAVQVGPGQMGMMEVCNNEDCLNPVSAEAMPCGAVRSNEAFCGIAGKYYKKKEEAPKNLQEIRDRNVIQLT